MKARWLQQRRADRAMLFMNGWGMDERITRVAPLPPDWDVLMFNDYRDLSVPDSVVAQVSPYDRVVVVAWSMGVWAAGALLPLLPEVAGSVAVNGTGRPIHPDFGISPKVYRVTAERFGEEGRALFNQRMCGTSERWQRFRDAISERPLPEQGAELIAIQKQAEAGQPAWEFPFAKAIVGRQDAIIPAARQARYWKGRADMQSVDMPHVPFLDMSWPEMLAYACAD